MNSKAPYHSNNNYSDSINQDRLSLRQSNPELQRKRSVGAASDQFMPVVTTDKG